MIHDLKGGSEKHEMLEENMEIITYFALIAILATAINIGIIGVILLAAAIALRLCKNQLLHYAAVLPFGTVLFIVFRGLGYSGQFSLILAFITAAWFLFVVYQRIHGTFTKEHLLDIAKSMKAKLLGKESKAGSSSTPVAMPDMSDLPDLEGI